MKKYSFIHALILTPFEEAILGNDAKNWKFVSEQDYCVHALFNKEKKKLVFLGTNLTSNISDQIEGCIKSYEALGNLSSVEQKIIVINFGEDELDKKFVERLLR